MAIAVIRGPRCARIECENPVRYRVELERGFVSVLILTHACELPHLKEFMYATSHLGADRKIVVVGDFDADC